MLAFFHAPDTETLRPMSKYFIHVVLAVLIVVSDGYADGSTELEMAPTFTLEDQHKESHTLRFPRKRPLVLSIADPGGAKDAPVWTDTIKKKYGDRIAFWSMANLQFIPAAARGAARLGIKASSPDIVLCDWEGKVAASFKAEKGKAHIIVISHTGEILRHASGKAEEAKVKAVFETLDAAIEKSQEDRNDD